MTTNVQRTQTTDLLVCAYNTTAVMVELSQAVYEGNLQLLTHAELDSRIRVGIGGNKSSREVDKKQFLLGLPVFPNHGYTPVGSYHFLVSTMYPPTDR